LAISLPASSEADGGAKRAEDSPETRGEFDRLVRSDWREVFRDPCTKDWREFWFLDGREATVKNTPQGMELTAGPEFRKDAHHMVLWTKREAIAGSGMDRPQVAPAIASGFGINK